MDIELERTYLARHLPFDINDHVLDFWEMIDIYVPKTSVHPTLRIRKKGDKYEMTKKTPVNENDHSHFEEHTIKLTSEEFEALKTTDGKVVSKIRYLFEHEGRMAEIDVFTGDLAGLIVVDFEFSSIEEKNNFEAPDFCLVEVTEEDFIAGGMLCGKCYEDISGELDRVGYVRIG